jgi:hypothetical protein
MQKFEPLFGKEGKGNFCGKRAGIPRRTLVPGHYRKSECMPIDDFEQFFNRGAVRRVLAPMRKKGDAFAID